MDQHEDRQGSWPHDPTGTAAPGGQGHRVSRRLPNMALQRPGCSRCLYPGRRAPALTEEMKRTTKSKARFAVCIKNRGYEASLEIGKLYRVIRDRDAEAHGYLRIVDESGEDYGYAADRFFAIDLPKPLEKVLLKVAS